MTPKRIYGLLEADWEAARAEIHALLVELARERETITYSQLANQLKTVRLHPGAYAFHALLRSICGAEHEAGRALLCALVVSQRTKRPGKGYYTMAAKYGRDVSDTEACWQAELELIYAQYE